MKVTIVACSIAALSLAFSKAELLGDTVKKPPSKQQASKGKKGNKKNNKNGKGKGKTEAQKRKENTSQGGRAKEKGVASRQHCR